jgi:hypothetical protein
MPDRSRLETDYHQPRFTQLSESHCGPAVVQMMLSALGIDISQENIVDAAGAADRLEEHGTRVDQLSLAVRRLVPELRFYFKDHATLDDLARIVEQEGYPVGVEWQGLFEGEPESEEAQAAGAPLLPDSESEDSDFGHYSLVIRVYPERRVLIIADPYKDYISQDRVFTFREFDRRWFDYNEAPNPKSKRKRYIKDDHMLFVIVPPNETFPEELGMQTFEEAD